MVKSPIPYSGGKSRIAHLAWQRFGRPYTYIEPFYGSGAVHLAAPVPCQREIVNDKEALVANLFRSLREDYEAVAYYADWPVNHTDYIARRRWLKENPLDVAAYEADPHVYDPQVAGYYAWVVGNSIDQQLALRNKRNMPHTTTKQGVQAPKSRKVPLIAADHNMHRGVQALAGRRGVVNSGERLLPWLSELAERLRETVILSKDWADLFSPTLTGTTKHTNRPDQICAVYFDPPYAGYEHLYTVSEPVQDAVKAKAIELGANPRFRVAVSCYDHDWPRGWTKVEWKSSHASNKANKGKAHETECLAFSPHCVPADRIQPLNGRMDADDLALWFGVTADEVRQVWDLTKKGK